MQLLSLHQEKQRHPHHRDQRANHFLEGYLLLVDEGVGHDDEHGREGHQGGGDAGLGVLHGHQRERHAEERPEEGGQGGEGHAFAVVEALADQMQLLR